MQDIRITLKELMAIGCYNQSAIARKVGMTPQQLTDVLKLRRKLEANEMLKICDAISISPSMLVRQEPQTDNK